MVAAHFYRFSNWCHMDGVTKAGSVFYYLSNVQIKKNNLVTTLVCSMQGKGKGKGASVRGTFVLGGFCPTPHTELQWSNWDRTILIQQSKTFNCEVFKILFNQTKHPICLVDFVMNRFFKGQFLIYKNRQISYSIDSFDRIFVANCIHGLYQHFCQMRYILIYLGLLTIRLSIYTVRQLLLVAFPDHFH